MSPAMIVITTSHRKQRSNDSGSWTIGVSQQCTAPHWFWTAVDPTPSSALERCGLVLVLPWEESRRRCMHFICHQKHLHACQLLRWVAGDRTNESHSLTCPHATSTMLVKEPTSSSACTRSRRTTQHRA
eukprot:2848501-Amphidinium_carterae.1